MLEILVKYIAYFNVFATSHGIKMTYQFQNKNMLYVLRSIAFIYV